jgi:hypothetical protein
MAVLNQQERMGLAYYSMNLLRVKKLGYGDSRVGSLTTVQTFIDDVETFRDGVTQNPANRPVFDAFVDSIRWMAANDLLTTTLVTALTTFGDTTVTATTDALYIATGHADYPDGGEGFDNTATGVSVFQPAA